MRALGSEQAVCRFLLSATIFDKNPMHAFFVLDSGQFPFFSF